MIITMTNIIRKITTKTRIINRIKTVTKGRITEMINIIKVAKSLNEKTYMVTKINIKTRVDLNKIKKEIILNQHSIVSKSHTTTIIIKKTTRDTVCKIGIIIIELAIT
jgi:hypothetical protein